MACFTNLVPPCVAYTYDAALNPAPDLEYVRLCYAGHVRTQLQGRRQEIPDEVSLLQFFGKLLKPDRRLDPY
jgi:hypothetical protein